jgi:hypothetical protein
MLHIRMLVFIKKTGNLKLLKHIIIITAQIVITSCSWNKQHNDSKVSFGGMKLHDKLALSELESNFDSPNDFILISHYGQDMDFNSGYEEGDSLVNYYKYQLTDSQEEQIGAVMTVGEKSKTICAPCGKDVIEKYKIVYKTATEKNIDKTIEVLESIVQTRI